MNNNQPPKVTKQDWFQNGVRMDLNCLIAKTTQQNEIIQDLTKKVNWLSETVSKLHSKRTT